MSDGFSCCAGFNMHHAHAKNFKYHNTRTYLASSTVCFFFSTQYVDSFHKWLFQFTQDKSLQADESSEMIVIMRSNLIYIEIEHWAADLSPCSLASYYSEALGALTYLFVEWIALICALSTFSFNFPVNTAPH